MSIVDKELARQSFGDMLEESNFLYALANELAAHCEAMGTALDEVCELCELNGMHAESQYQGPKRVHIAWQKFRQEHQ